MQDENSLSDSHAENGLFTSEFFLKEDYDTKKVVESFIDKLLPESGDLSQLAAVIEQYRAELDKFIYMKSKYIDESCRPGTFYKEVRETLDSIEVKAIKESDICSDLIRLREKERQISGETFNYMNELLTERAKVVAEKSKNDVEQMWACLETRMKYYIDGYELKRIIDLLVPAKEYILKSGNQERIENKKELLNNVEKAVWNMLNDDTFIENTIHDPNFVSDLYTAHITIDKKPEFFNRFLNNFKKKIENNWLELQNHSNDTGSFQVLTWGRRLSTTSNKNQTYISWIESFFDDSLVEFQNEMNNLATIHADNEICALYIIIQIFTSLIPSFSRRFSVLTYDNRRTNIRDIVDLYNLVQKFSKKMEKIIVTSIGPRSCSEFFRSETFINYSKELFGYFEDFQIDQFKFEKELLSDPGKYFENFSQKKEFSNSERFKTIFEHLDTMFGELSAVIKRCKNLSQGLGLARLSVQIDQYLKNSLNEIVEFVRLLQHTDNSPRNTYKFPGVSDVKNKASLGDIDSPISSHIKTLLMDLLQYLNCLNEFCLGIQRLSPLILKDDIFDKLKRDWFESGLFKSFEKGNIPQDICISSSTVLWKIEGFTNEILDLGKTLDNTKIEPGIFDISNYTIPDDDKAKFEKLRPYIYVLPKESMKIFPLATKKILDLISLIQQSIIENLLIPVSETFQCVKSELLDCDDNPGKISRITGMTLFPSKSTTKIGEHLLTLPHNLDSCFRKGSFSSSFGTLMSGSELENTITALMSRMKNYESPQSFKRDPEVTEELLDITMFFWMRSIVTVTKNVFYKSISSIRSRSLSQRSKDQLAENVKYLDNIVESLDIGMEKPFSQVTSSIAM